MYNWPDFLVNESTVIEVKGFWDSDSLKKVSAFYKRFPEYRLIFIDSDVYYDLNGSFGETIQHWEKTSVLQSFEPYPEYINASINDSNPFVEITHISQTRTVHLSRWAVCVS